MAWLQEFIKDPALAKVFNWYPVRKYLVDEHGKETRLWDDVDCGEDWWDVQVRSVCTVDVFSIPF
jgi:hypothetical protein